MQINVATTYGQFSLASSVKKADMDLLAKYRKDALTVKDEEGNEKFRIAFKDGGASSITGFGIQFNKVSADGCVVATATIPEGDGDVAGKVADFVGTAVSYLKLLEASVPTAAAEVAAERSGLIGAITVA